MKKTLSLLLVFVLLFSNLPMLHAAELHRYKEQNINNRSVKFIEIDYHSKKVKPLLVTAGDVMVKTETLKSMVYRKGGFAGINGGYFSSYGATKYPYPATTLIKDGRIMTVANNKSVIGFKKDGTAVIDILSFNFEYYFGEFSWCVPWNYNRPSANESAITIYTADFGAPVDMPPGSKAVMLKDNIVQSFHSSSFTVPKGCVAVHCNKKTAYVMDKIKVGDELVYKQSILTKYTKPEDWADVEYAVGSGPALLINGYKIADPKAEGFNEPKIAYEAHARSFIGVTKDGLIRMGNINAATISEAADICKSLGLHHAMCLDGGGSVNLYHKGRAIDVGRNLNNGLVFYMSKEPTGGDKLYQYGFIKGKNPTSKVLDEGARLSREELASIILEVNGKLTDAKVTGFSPKFADNESISFWAGPLVAYCFEKGLMKGTGDNMFSPQEQVKGRMLGQLMLRALGYRDVEWADVDTKLAELGLSIADKPLTRGEAFDFIWTAITKPIMPDGEILGVKQGKLKAGEIK